MGHEKKKKIKKLKSGKSTVKEAASPLNLTSPLHRQLLTEWSLAQGETKMSPDDGGFSFVQLQIESKCSRILQERGRSFHFSGLLTCGSFNCDKKKLLYFEQKGSSLCTNPCL